MKSPTPTSSTRRGGGSGGEGGKEGDATVCAATLGTTWGAILWIVVVSVSLCMSCHNKPYNVVQLTRNYLCYDVQKFREIER